MEDKIRFIKDNEDKIQFIKDNWLQQMPELVYQVGEDRQKYFDLSQIIYYSYNKLSKDLFEGILPLLKDEAIEHIYKCVKRIKG